MHIYAFVAMYLVYVSCNKTYKLLILIKTQLWWLLYSLWKVDARWPSFYWLCTARILAVSHNIGQIIWLYCWPWNMYQFVWCKLHSFFWSSKYVHTLTTPCILNYNIAITYTNHNSIWWYSTSNALQHKYLLCDDEIGPNISKINDNGHIINTWTRVMIWDLYLNHMMRWTNNLHKNDVWVTNYVNKNVIGNIDILRLTIF